MKNFAKRKPFNGQRKLNSPRLGAADSPYLQTNGNSSGTRVKQGDVIGFVGSTGKSTGPHLHYEIIVNGKQINPATLKLPSGRKLNENQLEEFKVLVSMVDKEVSNYKTDLN